MNIIEMAQECQLIGMRPHLDGIYQEALEKFAELVAAHEREACAALCFSIWNEWLDTPEEDRYKVLYDAEDCAAAIRARGKT